MDALFKTKRHMVKKYLMIFQRIDVIHYVEKPESTLSNLINCGIYIFTKDLFNKLKEAKEHKLEVWYIMYFY